ALGFPVVVKLARPAIAHKTEAGAVLLGVRDEATLVAGLARFSAIAETSSGGAVERVLVERQIEGAVAELIIGVKRDPFFGLALVVGAGGVLVDMVKDTATLLLPTTPAAVGTALGGLRVARLLAGYRGRPAGDVEAAVEAILAVAATAEAMADRLLELDVNPLLVLPRGWGAVGVDALIVIGNDPSSPALS